jgi:hypothetical protein
MWIDAKSHAIDKDYATSGLLFLCVVLWGVILFLPWAVSYVIGWIISKCVSQKDIGTYVAIVITVIMIVIYVIDTIFLIVG